MNQPLRELCDLIVDCPHSTAPDEGAGYPLVRTPNIGPGYLDLTNVHRVSRETYDVRNARAVPRPMDLILAREAPAGNVGIIRENQQVCLGQRTVLIRPDKSKVDPWFLNYYLNAPRQRHRLLSNANGATVSHVNMPVIRNLPVEVPSLKVQRRIASILMAYDNLIENNRRQIALLEEAARRLYKEWFIDLRFPGHEDVEIIDGVPNGWQKLCIRDVCTLVKETSREDDRTLETKYIGLEHMPKKSICLDSYGDATTVKGNKLCFKAGDILFGKIRPYFHKVGFAQCDGVASTDTIIMRANPGVFGLLLACVSTEGFVSYATKTSKTGTKMPRANWDAMAEYPLLIPTGETAEAFERIMKGIVDEILLASRSIAFAREARDRLLPKLISGEIEA